MVTTRLLPGYYLVTTWLLPGNYQVTTRLLPGYYLVTTWLLPGYYLVTTRLLPGYYLVTTWLLPGYYLVTTWLLPRLFTAPRFTANPDLPRVKPCPRIFLQNIFSGFLKILSELFDTLSLPIVLIYMSIEQDTSLLSHNKVSSLAPVRHCSLNHVTMFSYNAFAAAMLDSSQSTFL